MFAGLEPVFDAFVERVASTVVERLSERREPPQSPSVVDRAGLALALNVCVDTVDKLRRETGFPELRVGDSPRFEIPKVLEFLRGRA